MKTADVTDLAAEWITRCDAGLSPSDRARLEAWLGADPGHRATFEQLSAGWKKLDRPFEAGAADELLEELSVRAKRRKRRRTVRAGSALVLLVIAGFAWNFSRQGPETDAATAVASLPPSAPVMILPAHETLPDGTVVELKEGARILADFTPAERRVTLVAGEAHFQVTKDPARPFLVSAGGIRFRAVGTAFSVDLGATSVEMLVTEGRVAVEKPADNAANTTAESLGTVDAGSRVVVKIAVGAADIEPVAPAEVDSRLAWRAPRVEFTGTPLVEAIAALNHHALTRGTPRIVLGDPSLAPTRVSGLFRLDNTDAFVHLLHNGFAIEAESRGSEIVLYKAR
ncbi:MAG: anti-FecI sigma factor, FecR [Verrucomicrobia bacterium]|nr:anti-FecI sigma factor, FecR [Verrucomicrobiota bacterium]